MNTVRSSLFSNQFSVYLKRTCLRSYAFKSDLKIKWVRPEKIHCYKPEKTGDLEGITAVDKKQLLPEFCNSKELETAHETVKKLFTLEFASKQHINKTYIHKIVHKVKRHEFDIGSVEVKIARWTGIIRALQEVMEKFPHNKRLKVNLKELIDHRKKHLKYLRRWDYKKFEWLLETLNIMYKPPPNEFHWITRKESLQKLTNKYCDDLRRQRLETYQLQLENEQTAFLEEKMRVLQYIRDEQKKYEAEVTVKQEEIDIAVKQLKDLKRKI